MRMDPCGPICGGRHVSYYKVDLTLSRARRVAGRRYLTELGVHFLGTRYPRDLPWPIRDIRCPILDRADEGGCVTVVAG